MIKDMFAIKINKTKNKRKSYNVTNVKKKSYTRL